MKNFILVILSLIQLTISAVAFGIANNDEIEIIYASDSEIIYNAINNEELMLWHFDVLKSVAKPLVVAKPYINESIVSYKKIDNVEVYTLKNEELEICELWLYYEGTNILAINDAYCDTKSVSLYDNKLYIPAKFPLPFAPYDYKSDILTTHDLLSGSQTIEFNTRGELGLTVGDNITDIKHFSHYTLITVTDLPNEVSRVIKLDKNYQETPYILLSAPDGTEAGVKVIISDKLHIMTFRGYSKSYINLYTWNEVSQALEQTIESVKYDYEFTNYFHYNNELHATDGDGLFRVLEDGTMAHLAELERNRQGLFISNEQFFYTTSDIPFGKAYKVNPDYSSEYLFELISYNRSLVVADNLIFSFGDENNIGIYNQEEQSFYLVTLPTQIELPEISGVPSSVVNANEDYEFTPEIYDPLGIPLELTIENKPSWATFDPITGAITGNPVGVAQYDNIIITVSNGYLEVTLPAFSIQVLEEESNENPKSSGGAISYLLFIICISYLLRRLFLKRTA